MDSYGCTWSMPIYPSIPHDVDRKSEATGSRVLGLILNTSLLCEVVRTANHSSMGTCPYCASKWLNDKHTTSDKVAEHVY